MTVLFLVALGFLAVLAYGTVLLGATNIVFERLAQKQDRGGRKREPKTATHGGGRTPRPTGIP